MRKLKEAKDKLAKTAVENNTINKPDDVTDESINLEDNYVANFHWNQNRNRFNRTGPSISAESPVCKNKCDECENSFKTKEELKSYMKVHRETQGFKCDKCRMSTKTYRQLKNHIEIKHRAKSIFVVFGKNQCVKNKRTVLFCILENPRHADFNFTVIFGLSVNFHMTKMSGANSK